ncbi:MAG: hypothetical protein K2X11_03655 [Acetobacteraceae bacterium]|nr:hypothetical protein [Acetobacteraceae bacterium]
MAALTSIASLVGAGAGLYAQVEQMRRTEANQRAQAEAARIQDTQRREQLTLQQQADARARGEQLARTVAAARARIAAGGRAVEDGSAAAVTAGLRTDAAAAQSDSDALFRARLAAGRPSLLQPDGSLTPGLIRAVPSFGNALRNLLE